METISFRRGDSLSANQQMKIEMSDPVKLVLVLQYFSWVCCAGATNVFGATELRPLTTLLKKKRICSVNIDKIVKAE